MQILPKILIESFQSHGQYLWPPWHHVKTLSTNMVNLSRGCKSKIAGLRFAIQETKNDQKRQDTSRGICTETNSKVKVTATSTLTKQRSIQIFSYSQLPWRRRAVMMCCTFTPPIRRSLRSSFDTRFAVQQRKGGQKKQDKTRRIYTEWIHHHVNKAQK